MILKKHIQLSFLAILALFALNIAINFWSIQKKGAAIELQQQATSRQAITTTVKQATGDMQKQVARLGQIRIDAATNPLAAGEIEQFNLKAAAIAAQIAMLNEHTNDEARPEVEALQKNYADLVASWRFFYENFGVNHVKALTELALRAEPLSQRLMYEAVPLLEERGKRDMETARQELKAAQWWSDRTAAAIFAFSLLAAAAIALQAYRRLARGLNTLKHGVEAIGNGDTGHSIVMRPDDELGEIAGSFNSLAAALHTNRDQISHLDQEVARYRVEIENQRQVSESLLRNILPAKVAEEFRMTGSVEPKYLEDATIVFADFVGFSSFTEKLAAEDLVRKLHEYFSAFDDITERYGLEKMKTIGDSYMCAGGLPERNPSHPVDAVMAAMEIVRVVTERTASDSQQNWAIRVGIHTGHLIAGIVGKQKFAYDIWGESVNYASRLEASGEPNRIALSEQTYSRVKDFFECEKQSKISAKGSQKMEMYFVNGILPSLTDDSKQIPPPAFLRRYRSYFQKDPPSFPSFIAR